MKRWVPTPGDLVDAAAVAVLGLLALLGFANTYEGVYYLKTGMIALGIGVLCSFVLTALRQPVVVLAAVTLVVYVVTGPILLGSGLSVSGVRAVAETSVLGWKQLLTTVPPVEAGSPLTVIPYLLGMFTGVIAMAAAQRSAQRVRPGSVNALVRSSLPVLAPVLTLVAVVALGTDLPGAKLADGVVFAVVCLMWTAGRLRRFRPPTRSTSHPVRRTITGAALLGLAGAAAFFVTPVLPGSHTPRTVLRDHVVPPFDINAYPSPLVGFRKYTKDANLLWDQTLFTVTGLPEGAAVRIAALDDYDGTVWGATESDAFRLVGQRVAAPAGPLTTVHVKIGAAYAASSDTSAWLPEAGTVSRIAFEGARAEALGSGLHYSVGLSAGVVTSRLHEGDEYTLTTTLVNPTLPDDAQPYTRPDLTESAQGMLSSKVASWTAAAPDLKGRLAAAAAYLQNNGAYTDGGPGETQYLPGHSLGRIGAFLKDPTPAGDDEQYAAVYALIANYLGVPARVVFGATPDRTGAVRGQDVHAWVEVHLADGSWVPIPQTRFMPDPSKHPHQQPPQSFENQDTPVVPPPNAVHLPTTPLDTSRTDPFHQPIHEPPWWRKVLDAVLGVLVWVGPPVLPVVLFVGTVLGLKARRRRRRSRTALAANRYVGAWQELVDRVRDLAAVKRPLRTDEVRYGVPQRQVSTRRAHVTRLEHARALDTAEVLAPKTFTGLATRVDEIVYGTAQPTHADAAAFWAEVDKIGKTLTAGLSAWQRVRVALSLQSLRVFDPTYISRKVAAAGRAAARRAARAADKVRAASSNPMTVEGDAS